MGGIDTIPTPRKVGKKMFVLRDDASPRTKSRWAAHEKGYCNSKCRFCRRDRLDQMIAHEQKVALHTDDRGRASLPSLPTAEGVLAGVVADQYHLAAAKVAHQKAMVEVGNASFIPGMMVYHRFDHHRCILLAETRLGYWKIILPDGNKETEVPAAILTPLSPNIFARMFRGFLVLWNKLFFTETEFPAPGGSYTVVRKFRASILVAWILATTISMACIYLSMFHHPRH
jgi:hypothetical protein